MRVLFDQGVPVPLRRVLSGHTIETVYERGWATLKNGALLSAAEAAGFEMFVTTDQQLRFQQNLAGRRLAILVLGTTSWPRIRAQVARVQSALDMYTPGSYHEVAFDPMP
jgi:predicted nuclease of predicted toxin-antitoxin system